MRIIANSTVGCPFNFTSSHALLCDGQRSLTLLRYVIAEKCLSACSKGSVFLFAACSSSKHHKTSPQLHRVVLRARRVRTSVKEPTNNVRCIIGHSIFLSRNNTTHYLLVYVEVYYNIIVTEKFNLSKKINLNLTQLL